MQLARKGSSARRAKRVRNSLGQLGLAIVVLVGIFFLVQFARQLELRASDVRLWGFFQVIFGNSRPRVGLVAGHWQSDSGAVCPDGLREVDINLDVAERTATLLRRAGYRVDLLSEFDARLNGYSADVFLSIHADSCVKGLSGFKVARLPDSKVGEQADRLITALYREYAAVTHLTPHVDTITYDMTDYHAFREIAPDTPGAIIEIGFMGEDRDLLTRRADLVARGIARGIIAFLEEQRTLRKTPPAP